MNARAETIARELGGAKPTAGGWLCRCPVPSHGQGRGDRNPSLFVKDGNTAPLFSCFSGCERSDITAELRQRGLLNGQRNSSARGNAVLLTPSAPMPNKKALGIWKDARPIAGSLAERYLEEHRGLPGPHPLSLRFASSLEHAPSGTRLPAMVAAVHAPDRSVIAVQATYLRSGDGRKAPVSSPRLSFGSLGSGAVRLFKADEVLGLAEGTEDALAAQHLTGVPCWACIGATRMHRVWIPPAVRTLHIFADDDEAGSRAAERTARLNRHLRVEKRLPPLGFKDWAEVAMERTPA